MRYMVAALTASGNNRKVLTTLPETVTIGSMKLSRHIKTIGGEIRIDCPVLAAVADAAGCAASTLYMIALGHKKAGPLLARAIESATGGAVTRYELREDVFGAAPPKARAA